MEEKSQKKIFKIGKKFSGGAGKSGGEVGWVVENATGDGSGGQVARKTDREKAAQRETASIVRGRSS